jgi:hypothetical protein
MEELNSNQSASKQFTFLERVNRYFQAHLYSYRHNKLLEKSNLVLVEGKAKLTLTIIIGIIIEWVRNSFGMGLTSLDKEIKKENPRLFEIVQGKSGNKKL